MNKKFGKILAEISVGELFDKITILQIKKSKIKDKDKLNNIKKELNSLNETLNEKPEQVNEDPYGQGWMIRIKLNTSDTSDLLNSEEYKKLIGA